MNSLACSFLLLCVINWFNTVASSEKKRWKNDKWPSKKWPTPEPTEWPTPEPTEWPTPEPTEWPTPEPTEWPTPEPTEWPTPEPSEWKKKWKKKNGVKWNKKDKKKKWKKKDKKKWPTPEPTLYPTGWKKKKHKKYKKHKKHKKQWPTPEPTEWPTPEPTEWPTPEPTKWTKKWEKEKHKKHKKNKKNKKQWPTPEPTEWPTPEPIEYNKKKWKKKNQKKHKKQWPTPQPTKWKKKLKKKWKNENKKRDGCDSYKNSYIDYVIFLDNSCGFKDSDCDIYLSGVSEIIYRVLNYPYKRIKTVSFGETRKDLDYLVDYDDIELQKDAGKYAKYIKENGECRDGGNGKTNLYYALQKMQDKRDPSKDTKYIIISGCKHASCVGDGKVCKLSDEMDKCGIQAYIVNIVGASCSVENVFSDAKDAKNYLLCLTQNDKDRICVGDDGDGISVAEFDDIIDNCLYPNLCKPNH